MTLEEKVLVNREYAKTLANALNKKQYDWAENDPNSSNYIKNRTHYSEIKEVFTNILKWDGNTTNLITTSINNMTLYKVSDIILDVAHLDNVILHIIENGEEYSFEVPQDEIYDEGNVIVILDPVFIVKENNVSFYDIFFPEAGIYFAHIKTQDVRVSQLELPIDITPFTTVKEIIHKIDKKYLPDHDIPGEKLEGQIFTIYDPTNDWNEYEAVARIGAERFNSYMDYDEQSFYQSIAIGKFSHAEGHSTQALGDYSHAEGSWSSAIGKFSHAEGHSTQALGDYSHAEGYSSYAEGFNSHAEGRSTSAVGEISHAEGINTIALGSYSHAEGDTTIASGDCQHVQGKNNIEDTENKYAHIVGNGENDAELSNAHTLDWNGNAWFAGDVYVGSTSGTNQDKGSKKLATEEYINTEVSNLTDVVSIKANKAELDKKPGLKYNNKEINYQYYDGAQQVTIKGYASPNNPEIFNDYTNNIASGDYSHAEGQDTLAHGWASHAEGTRTQASGTKAHAEGEETKAIGDNSHTEGVYTIAIGHGSHAEGMNAKTKGNYSHAEGLATIASGQYQHAQGKFNIEDTEEQYAHIIGNGNDESHRANAHTLDWQGNAWFAGNITLGPDNKEVATKVDLNNCYTKAEVDAIVANAVATVKAEIMASLTVISDVPMTFGIANDGGLTVTYNEQAVNA